MTEATETKIELVVAYDSSENKSRSKYKLSGEASSDPSNAHITHYGLAAILSVALYAVINACGKLFSKRKNNK